MDDDAGNQDLLARRSTLTFARLCAVVALIASVAWHYLGRVSHWHWYVALATVLLCLAIVQTRRQLPAVASAVLFLICAAVMVLGSVLSTNLLLLTEAHFGAFNGYKLVAFAVAVIAPVPVWVGYLVVGVCGIAPILHYFALPPEARALFLVQEPWITLVYAVIAFAILRHRLLAIRLERTLSRMKAERQALDDVARIFLGLRDLTNTPLQSIELTTHLLRTGNLAPEEAADHLESSLVRLRDLSQVLTSYEKDVDWATTASSFDAVALLQKKVAELRARGHEQPP